MVNDPVANFITTLKNGSMSGKASVSIPYSKFVLAIAEVLSKHGFIGKVSKKGKKIGKSVDLDLIYDNKSPKINDVDRISKLSKRVYYGVNQLRNPRGEDGLLILSTTEGVLTHKEAREKKVGGEALFIIW